MFVSFCASFSLAFVAPIIDKGEATGIPATINRDDKLEKIGATVHIVQGASATIDCSVFDGTGLPLNSVEYAWFYNGMRIVMGEKFSYTVADDLRSTTLTVNNLMRTDNGMITCEAFNPAGSSQATSEVFGECYKVVTPGLCEHDLCALYIPVRL